MTYTLELGFDTDDPEFARGVEIGALWGTLSDPGEVTVTIHASNAEMAMRMAERQGRTFTADLLAHDWAHVHFGPAEHPASVQ